MSGNLYAQDKIVDKYFPEVNAAILTAFNFLQDKSAAFQSEDAPSS